METREKKPETMDDKTVEMGVEKKPYQAPRLSRLGDVKQLTEGIPDMLATILPS